LLLTVKIILKKTGRPTFSARKKNASVIRSQVLPSGKDVFPPLIAGVGLYYKVMFKDEMQPNLHHYDKA